jgi:septum formation protein
MIADDELERYLATGEWQGCVGSYRVEGQGLKLFQRVEGDVLNARGLPLVRVLNALRDLGFPLF